MCVCGYVVWYMCVLLYGEQKYMEEETGVDQNVFD